MLNELDELIDITHERFARYTIDPDERIEDVRDDVLGLLVQARLEHPGQELEVIFRARLEPSREETHHGRTGRHVRR